MIQPKLMTVTGWSRFLFKCSPKQLLALACLLLVSGCAAGSKGDEKEIRISHTSVLDFDDLASLRAEQLLAQKGYRLRRTYYAQSELAVQALARGDADLGYGATRAHWAAIAKGAPVVTLMEQAAGTWMVVARPSIKTCADLHDRKLGQHSEASVGRALLDGYLIRHCPSVRPQVITIPGSGNRAAALLRGVIDAAVVELIDMIEIDRQAPGRFRLLVDFSHEMPGLNTTGLHANLDFLRRHPKSVNDFVEATVQVHREIAESGEKLTRLAHQRLGLEPNLLGPIIAAYRARGIWNVNGGMTEDSVTSTLDFLKAARALSTDLSSRQVADLTSLRRALDHMRSGADALPKVRVGNQTHD